MNSKSILLWSLVSAGLLLSGGRVQAETIADVPAEWRKAFGSIEADPHPEKLTRDSHYWVSDEKRHDLFRDAIADSGGVFVGLGTDQNYLMAAWAKPEVLVPLDFDQMVVYMHYIFRAVFLTAKNKEEFVDMWREDRKAELKKLLESTYAQRDEEFQKGVLRALKLGRKHVERRLKRILRLFRRLEVPTYLSDDDQFNFIVGLFKANRVFPVRGDLTATTTVRQVAAAARKSGLTIRTLYLSNAEQYFKYSNDFKENMFSLPFDERTRVIRTAGKRTEWAADGLYEYVVQKGDNFRAWLENPKTYNVWTIVGVRKVNKKTGLSWVERLPEQ